MGVSKFKSIVPSAIWKKLRLARILRVHSRVAGFCENLIEDFYRSDTRPEPKPLKSELVGRKIIWQYWAQGFERVPDVVKECLKSVDRFSGEYMVIRLDDDSVPDYVSIPDRAACACREAGIVFYSDLLRLSLLSVYGGIWLDATVMLSAPIKDRLQLCDFFMFQRNPAEPDKRYWEGTYAYYFGWHSDFRVNVLSSIIYSKPGSGVICDISGILTEFWDTHCRVPDYFFFQILFDVLINGRSKGKNCPIESDCLPHMLQQFRNDPAFRLASEEEILGMIEVHKLTYKHE